MTKSEELAKEHWKYVEGLINNVAKIPNLPLVKYIYIETFKHGFKHGEKSHEQT